MLRRFVRIASSRTLRLRCATPFFVLSLLFAANLGASTIYTTFAQESPIDIADTQMLDNAFSNGTAGALDRLDRRAMSTFVAYCAEPAELPFSSAGTTPAPEQAAAVAGCLAARRADYLFEIAAR